MEGERYNPKYPRDYPASPAGQLVIPYYPNLKRALKSVTASILVSYLEFRHPPPPDSPQARLTVATPPVTLDLDAVAQDIGITRRTLYVSICILSTRWRTEEDRASAARANREFIEPRHHRYKSIKVYSTTGPSTYRPGTIIQLRRNRLVLDRLLQRAGFPRDPQRLAIPNTDLGRMPVSALSEHDSGESGISSRGMESLSDILLRASVLDGDRRSVRYSRLRAAIEAGIRPTNALKPRRHSGNQ